MAKLTPTEIKVLAVEATNQIIEACRDKKEKRNNSSKYLNWEDTFNKSALGNAIDQLVLAARAVDKLAGVKDIFKTEPLVYKTITNVYRNSQPTSVQGIIERECDKIQNKAKELAFPEIGLILDRRKASRYGGTKDYELAEYIEHRLRLEQLTTNADLSKMLNSLIKELVAKIE